MIILLSLGYIFTEPLMGILTQYDASQMDLPVTLARITLIQALLHGALGHCYRHPAVKTTLHLAGYRCSPL